MGVQVGLNDRRYSRARWPSRQNLFKLQALSNGQIVDLSTIQTMTSSRESKVSDSTV